MLTYDDDDEICHVDGLRYAKDVAFDMLRHKARPMGFGIGPTPG